MTRLRFAAAALGLTLGALAVTPADAWKRGEVNVLAELPFATGSVEGITVGPDGNIYAPTFGFNANGEITTPPQLFVISPNGKIIRKVTIANSSPHVLGLRFNPATGALWVLDFGGGNVLNVDPNTGNSSILASPGAGAGINALTFDASGNGYVSASFSGAIYKVPAAGGSFSTWKADPLLGPGTGLTPPFGANGVEFSNDRKFLFVANTAFHQIIKIAVNGDGSAGAASIFVTGLNAPDGIAIDRSGNMWICANQEDEIVVVDTNGKAIAKFGDFNGLDEHGIARGLLFPASLAFNKDSSILYVANLTLDLRFFGLPAAIDSDWTRQAKGYTISSLKTKIPPFQDGP
jgi:DNA-binding beta-propeller fold protein YncE